MTPPTPGAAAPAVLRAAAVLDVIARRTGAQPRVADIARETGIPHSSVTNILAALVETGFVRRAGAGFTIGPTVIELASAFLRSDDPVQRFREFVPLTSALSAETAQLGTLVGDEVLFLARHDGTQPIALTSGIGRRLPASSTAIGKAMLAQLEEAELVTTLTEPLTRLAPRSHASVASLAVDLAAIRRRGHAIDDEEAAAGVVCFAVAVDTPPGEPSYAVSTTLFKDRSTVDLQDRLVTDLVAVANHLAS